MIRSMTAYASRTGTLDDTSWNWDMRGVNGRGLDFKLRLPDGLNALDGVIRTAIKPVLNRGVVTVTLKLSKQDENQRLVLDEAQLERVLSALDDVQNRAFAMGVTLSQPTTADVLSQKGVIIGEKNDEDGTKALIKALSKDFEELLSDFVVMRETEGAALSELLNSQIDKIDALVSKAAELLGDRAEGTKVSLKAGIARVLDEVSEVDPERLAQELAILAVKQDVTEEVDRLRTHVAAARDILKSDQPIGRKFDFLSQEFNREANTLCAKSQFAPLTAVGLELKTVIDQMREQIQNVE